MNSRFSFVLLASIVACSTPPALVHKATSAPETPPIQLVESFPVETTLDHADIPDAADVWLEMIDGARTSLEMAEFYASDQPGSRLGPILKSIERAAARGVKVRLLFEEKFYATYPELIDGFAKLPANIEVRRIRFDSGILHAKYFVVDARDAYLGSQNLDWRSLEHIQELGVRVRLPGAVACLRDVFEFDWQLAANADADAAMRSVSRAAEPAETVGAGAEQLTVLATASPEQRLPAQVAWDLPRLLELIDSAREHVRVQLLTYKMTARDKSPWNELEDALRRAAARGVKVQLLLADWCKRRGTIEGLQALEPLDNVEIRLVTIPPWSGGFIPFARVVHAKYMVVDGQSAWIGTSNWERDYFYESRNVGLIVEGASFAKQLERVFADGWNSAYAQPVDPQAKYDAPRIDK